MLIIAHHNISDPETFWKAAKEVTSSLPPGLKLHAVYPSQDQKTGTCIWEAGSVEEVQKFLDNNVGKISRNFCYELNTAAAFGLPAIQTAEALN